MSGSFRNLTYESSSGDDLQDDNENGTDASECGIGISLRQQKGNFFIDGLDPGGAGEKSGVVRVNQKILQVEGAGFLSLSSQGRKEGKEHDPVKDL